MALACPTPVVAPAAVDVVGVDPTVVIAENPERIGLKLAQVGNDGDQHVLHPLLVERERQMVMIDDVVALLRTPHDRDHVAAEILADLLRFLVAKALALVIDLAHADRHLGRPQAFDRYRFNDRVAGIGHGSAPFFVIKFCG